MPAPYSASKLLLDAYATAIEGGIGWGESLFTYQFADPDASTNDDDSAACMPRSVVTRPYFDWGTDRPPRPPWRETIVYEVHVKGFSARKPRVPDGLRGSLAEFAYRFTGSSDLYESHGRCPFASVNFVTAHDGIIPADLTSYTDRHNDANGEDNRDGEPQPGMELRGRGTLRRSGDLRTPGPAAPQHVDDAHALPGHPHTDRRR